MPYKKPLEGIRVCDFTWVGAGPLTTRQLAEFGAEVIRIESSNRIDLLRASNPYKDGIPGLNRSGYFAGRNPGKKSMDIDMKQPKARELVVEIIKKSDIVINSFTVGTMEKWGLGYEEVKSIKPDIIYVTMPAQGSDGPHKDYMGFGSTMNALVGYNYLIGFPDKTTFKSSTNYPDHVPNPMTTAFAIMAALFHRRKTGEGQLIEVAQIETMLACLPTSLMDYANNGRIQERQGYHDLNIAPHGVYATKGNRRWIAIAVYNQSEWDSLLKVMGNPEWAKDEKFATQTSRFENQDNLDGKIEEWTKEQEPYMLMKRLVHAGVRAGVLQNAKDLLQDPHLHERGFWCYLNHAEMRRTAYNNSPAKLSKTPAELTSPAPLIGEHTDEVLRDLLGLNEAEITLLRKEKVVG